ncbi:BglG family transcription antiterminator [Lentibacillus sediminis]|uniref:BglG family transcription antiterminator n=1 Tax=Lentibacillus sediminis TaxID=1940529 RepID=UPI001EFE1D25|nr:PRD domain-containing protein [Lentibacillus sediminis]
MSSLYLSGRERKILEYLLKAGNEAVTVKEIAVALKVSPRTIHRDLNNLEGFLAAYQLTLKKKAGSGVQIYGASEGKEQLESALQLVTSTDYTPEERRAILLAALLETNEPLKLFALAQELRVTEATVSHDLDQLESLLAANHLHLVRRRGYGVKINGGEKEKRAVISELIADNVDPFSFVSIIKETIQKKTKPQLGTISARLLGLMDPEKLAVIEKRVEDARSELPHDLADSAYVGLVVHLALAIERLQKGDTITFDPAYMRKIGNTKEYAIAKRIIADLETALDMTIPEDEVGYITMHLMGAKLRNDHPYFLEDSSVDIAVKTRELIERVGSELGTDLHADSALLKDLVAHLKPTMYRLEQGMNIKNPMIAEIKRDYLELHEIIRQAVEEVFPDIDFPDDEIGYLVLHFASVILTNERDIHLRALVICSSGIGTAKILATKLMQRVPEIKQVDNKSMFDLAQTDTTKYDLVVSTVPLQGTANYVLASPMLTKGELERIHKQVRQRKLIYRQSAAKSTEEPMDFLSSLTAVQQYSETILAVMRSFSIIDVDLKSSLDSLLRLACADLEKSRTITSQETIYQRLRERGEISGLGIPDTSLALYHSRSDAVLSPRFSIYSLKEPISVASMDGGEGKMKRMLLMLAPSEASSETLEIMSYISSLIIQSIGLFESGNEKDIAKFLSEQFQAFIQEKI